MLFPDDQLVLGRGRVYFEPFAPGTRTGQGERYIGNTTSFQVTREVKRQARMISVGGRKYEDFGAVLEESHNVTFVTDNIDIDNVTDFFGLKSESDFLSVGFVSETFKVTKGRHYQLGKHLSPFGVRHALVVAVKIEGVAQDAADWDSDTVAGRLYIPLTSTIPDGTTITVDWESRDQAVRSVSSESKELWGALRFISDNADGGQRHVLLPCVRLFARGAVDLKGDQWQQLPFEADATNLTPAFKQVYIDFVDADPGLSVDDKWFSANPVPDFEFHEDQLDISVNIGWPEALLDEQPVYYYDSVAGIENPANAGLSLFGSFDLLIQGVGVYRGLSGPFVRPAIATTYMVAYRSTEDVANDAVLTSGGTRRSAAPSSGLVLSDNDIWSVGTNA